MACPTAEQIAPVGTPELVVDEPEHRHIRVGPLEFCFRCHRARGWIYEGAVTAAVGHVVSAATWGESFRVAREAMVLVLQGKAPNAGRTGRCPECEALFPEPPSGPAPHDWQCGPEHWATSARGDVTIYRPGEPPQHHPIDGGGDAGDD